MIVGGAVKAIRELKAASDDRYKGSQFAITCGMSHAQLCNIEASRRFPHEDVIHVIAAHLGVPVDAISYTVPMEAVA